MGAICAIRFTETWRANLGLSLAIINWICILGSLVLVAVGTYIKFLVEPYTLLIEEEYDDSTLPYFLIGSGCAWVCVQIAGGLVCFLNGDPNQRPHRKVLFIPYMIVTAILLIVIFVGAILCFTHISHLGESFEGGLVAAMDKYRDHMEIKDKVDKIQMNYKCCGSEGYSDWFEVAWVNEEYLNTADATVQQHMTSGDYKNDDVPFSCCDPESMRPCIHVEVHNNKEHFKYDYQTKTTLHSSGCKESLMEYFGKILTEAGAVIIGICALQVIVLIMVRYLQTSIYNAVDDPEEPSQGYLIFIPETAEKARPPSLAEIEQEENLVPVASTRSMSKRSSAHSRPNSYTSFKSHHTYQSIPANVYQNLTPGEEGNDYAYHQQGSVPGFRPPPPPGQQMAPEGQYMEVIPDHPGHEPSHHSRIYH